MKSRRPRCDLEAPETLGTPSNDGDDLEGVVILHPGGGPEPSRRDAAVVFGDHKQRIVPKGGNHRFETGGVRGGIQAMDLTVDCELQNPLIRRRTSTGAAGQWRLRRGHRPP